MTHEDFKKNKQLVELWAAELRTELMRTVLDVMERWHPVRHAIHRDLNNDVSPTLAAIAYGEDRGYSLYADRLRQLAAHAKPISNLPESTYEKDEDKSAKVAHTA